MTIYVPGTEERDQKKQNISLQQLGAAITAMQSAWTSYTPVITASSGTFTTVSATGKYNAIGKTVFFQIAITITTVGTASGNVIATLPVTGIGSNFIAAGASPSGGSALAVFVGSTTCSIFRYDAASPIGAGVTLAVSGTYEAA